MKKYFVMMEKSESLKSGIANLGDSKRKGVITRCVFP